ncbi:unnamed protein product [Gadus morhua 'NCC']
MKHVYPSHSEASVGWRSPIRFLFWPASTGGPQLRVWAPSSGSGPPVEGFLWGAAGGTHRRHSLELPAPSGATGDSSATRAGDASPGSQMSGLPEQTPLSHYGKGKPPSNLEVDYSRGNRQEDATKGAAMLRKYIQQ